VVVDDMAARAPFKGKTGAARWLEEWAGAVPDAATEIASIVAVGNAVLVETVVRGTLRGPLGLLQGTGRAFSIHRALVMELAGGKVARMSVFMNTKELAEATGQWPPRPK
jgi:ketosteroid isomerase-like protein